MECLQKKADCVNNRGGACRILSDTKFTRPCPFYKRRIRPEREYIFDDKKGTFKMVKGYGDTYLVSDYGEVINNKGRALKYRWAQNCVCVELRFRYMGVLHTPIRPVHSLVADAFLPVGDTELIHIDGDPWNCRADNLKWRDDNGNKENNSSRKR